MKVTPTDLAGLLILEPRRFADTRGFFSEVWNEQTMAEAGLSESFVQDNQSLSAKAGTVRGLHYQAPPHGQGKLVRCGRGVIWDVAVDARRGSPTYGQWTGVELSAENGLQLFIPVGFLHGFSTMTDDAEILYKCTTQYAPEADGAVRFDSAALGIDWKLGGREPLLSDKDLNAPDFDAWDSPFHWGQA
ncbi:dTDP-4-dehydrorhamnose 3,5-epimerase [Ovoidimarina sediminis]|uniref:dTDP-4-dehydrorhamnose 3,5-epimerase n=1 Tax=Ovoidimarina sediminis TaxID=3079856 RepID=UPI0029064F85|nr:dTDP-4-dehydrorhamnose 3,5-epimerase [Rhodophyticola sp. MJ-SS7]MDU8943264.1 dTDP-4-dehydrorhamnose 3,5-epimerase [Rhodophyticola sp. MJ-SS7]